MTTVEMDWLKTEAAIRELLDVSRAHMSSEAVAAVEHYLEHAEYEMALEGLLLEIMARAPVNLPVDWALCSGLVRQLGLDRESTFDGAFWQRFENYVAGHRA